jgi:uncharacterized metal-binding protein YceD (DUF177 family)
MFDLKQFTIPFAGLKQGEHRFDFTINELFFEEFGYSELKKGHFEIDLVMLRQNTMLTLSFDIKGKAMVTCDRCLDEFEMSVESQQRLFVKFGNETYEETDEVLVLSHHEQELDISQYVYEFVLLSVPQVRVHPEGECDPEVIRKLEELQPKNDDEDTDPRWDALKNLGKN